MQPGASLSCLHTLASYKCSGAKFLSPCDGLWNCRRRTYLPDELTTEEGVSQEAIFRGEDSEGLRNVVFQVASTAKVPRFLI